MLTLDVQPIGQVRRLADDRSALDINPAYLGAAADIQPGDRIDVLYWMHQLEPSDCQRLRVHPRGDPSRPRRGVFSLRSPMRPNPIGVSAVQVVEVEGDRLVVSGLDAQDGSPVIDIKSQRGRGEVRRLVETWGRIHDAMVSAIEAASGTGRVRELLYEPIRELGRRAASGHAEDAEAIGREILRFEALWDIEGRVVEAGPERFVREVTACPWDYFHPLSCRVLAWWMEGFCEGLNAEFGYSLERLVPEGDACCRWTIARRNEEEEGEGA
ncbi:MAG: tRNA (N6-threonylcarbamoyladenosine(37)-N6)-methyltransferase TrmO [Planctomycetota bacterium]